MHEQIAVVQAYINHRTGQTVQIRIDTPFDVIKLNKAYQMAVEWFENNNGQINIMN